MRTYEHKVFAHHLYEYGKGLRSLVLYTTNASNRETIEKRLTARNVGYYIQDVNGIKLNVFFGDKRCVDVVRQMNFEMLSDLTTEEDFILGIMLGYDRLKQCERYLKRKRIVSSNSRREKKTEDNETSDQGRAYPAHPWTRDDEKVRVG